MANDSEEFIGIDDRCFSRRLYPVYCLLCKHFTGDVMGPWKCAAFDEIPVEIWEGRADHREPYEGDQGIQFEPGENTSKEAIETAFNELDDMKEG